MRIFSTILILVLLNCGCQQQAPVVVSPSGTPEAKRPLLIAMGDSLTEGLGVETEKAYPAQLEARLEKDGLDWEVVNSGVSGETSSAALSRLEWVMKAKPDAILLVTGANDGLRGIDPTITQQNLDSLVTQIKQSGTKVMLGGMKAPANLGDDYTRKFEQLYPAVAQKHEVPLIPFFLEGVAKNPELNQADGKHPTEEGYSVIVEQIAEPVKSWLGS